jgi:simple sugar transport system permease protein
MLNNIAAALAIGLVAGPLKGGTGLSTSTEVIDESTWLPNLYQDLPFRLSLALPLAVLLVWALAVWIKRSVAGYELCATGANAGAAATAGVEVKKVTVRAMAISGALAGLAGAIQVLAYEHNFYTGFSSGFGFDALGVALLAGTSAWGVIPAAFAFGVLAKGTTTLQALGVPKGLSGLLLGTLIIVFAAFRYRRVRAHD